MSDKTLKELITQIREKQETPRGCLYCGTEFSPNRDWQKFCSPNCRFDYHEAKARLNIQKLEAELAKMRETVQESQSAKDAFDIVRGQR